MTPVMSVSPPRRPTAPPTGPAARAHPRRGQDDLRHRPPVVGLDRPVAASRRLASTARVGSSRTASAQRADNCATTTNDSFTTAPTRSVTLTVARWQRSHDARRRCDGPRPTRRHGGSVLGAPRSSGRAESGVLRGIALREPSRATHPGAAAPGPRRCGVRGRPGVRTGPGLRATSAHLGPAPDGSLPDHLRPRRDAVLRLGHV
jgi:hypothetical protein